MNVTVCYEKIKNFDNKEFHKALYGDFHVIVIKSTDNFNGYINASKLCKNGGKRLHEWTKLEKSKSLIEYFEKNLGGEDLPPLNQVDLGGTNYENNLISGTYFHPDIIVHLAIWISNEFALKVSKIVNEHFIKENKKLLEEINNKNTEIICKNTEIINKNTEINNKNDEIKKLNTTIDILKPKVITDPLEKEKFSTFTLIKLNVDNPRECFNYYITTVNERSYSNTIKKLTNLYKDLKVILRFDRVPNAKYLLNHIKKSCSKSIDVNRNYLDLIPYSKKEFWITETDLINKIYEIYNFDD